MDTSNKTTLLIKAEIKDKDGNVKSVTTEEVNLNGNDS